MTRDDLTNRIFIVLRDELLNAGERFTPESGLVEFGLDSLTLTQLLLSIEEMTGVWIDEGSVTTESLSSTKAFAELVYAQTAKP